MTDLKPTWHPVIRGAGAVTGYQAESARWHYLTGPKDGGPGYFLTRWTRGGLTHLDDLAEAVRNTAGVATPAEGRRLAEMYEAGLEVDLGPAWRHEPRPGSEHHMSEARMAYDPIPDLAALLGSAQRLLAASSAGPGFAKVVTRLTAGLELPELARLDETEQAIREALRSYITPAGRLITTAEIRGWVTEAERGYDLTAAPPPHPELGPGSGHQLDGPADCRRCQLLRDNASWLALPGTEDPEGS